MTNWKLTSTRTDPANEASVIFVHGFTGDSTSTWADFPKLVAEDEEFRGFDVLSFGYQSNLIPDLRGIWRGDPDIRMIADSLRTFIQSTLPRHRALVLFAHSMGGLVVQRALVDGKGFRDDVRKVILFGTPSFGLLKAWPFRLPILGLLNVQARDMARGGKFITSLRSRWAELSPEFKFDFLAVAGAEDQFVPRSASIDGFPDAQCAVVPGDHLQIVKPTSKDDASFRVARAFLGARRDPAAEHYGTAALLLERREFDAVIARLWPNRKALDRRALVELALALDAVGRRHDSMDVLADAKRHGTDAMGVLAGRHKRNWIQERRQDDGDQAMLLYREAYGLSVEKEDDAQAYYHAINVAFLERVFRCEPRPASEWAGRALVHCAAAAPNETPHDTYWRLATEGEAHLIRGEVDAAVAAYEAATRAPRAPEPWKVVSTSQQAFRIADELGDEAAAKRLLDLFRGGR